MKSLLQTYRTLIPWFIGVLFFVGLYLISLQNYLLFHGLVEIFSIVIAYSIFIIAWNTRNLHENHFFLFLGIAYLFVGSLDLLHTLGYRGMWVFPNHKTNLPAQLWIAARYLESISLLIAPLFFRKKLSNSLAFIIYALVFTGVMISIFYWHIFPDCFAEGSGLTRFKVTSEYIICLLLLGAIIHILQYRKQISLYTLNMIIAAFAFTILSEFSFTFYISAYSFSNMIGHFFKVLSFYCLYKALVQGNLKRPTELLFHTLDQSRKRMNLALEGANIGTWNWDIKTNKTHYDSRWFTMLGYDPHTLPNVYETWINLLHPHDLQPVEQKLKTAIKNEGAWSLEFRLKARNGHYRWIQGKGKVLERDGAGRPIKAAGTNLDITEQKIAEKKLQTSEARFRAIFDNAPFSISYLDKEMRAIKLNPLMEKLAGCTSDEAHGRYCYDVWGQYAADESRKGKERICDTCKAQNALKDGEKYVYGRHIEDRYIEITTTPVKDNHGQIIGVLECGNDITERKRAEEDLKSALKQLKAANTELSQFNYVVAHDLKAPFRAISNYSRFLQEDLEGVVSGTQQQYLEKLDDAVSEAGKLVEDLLFVAQIRGKKRDNVSTDMNAFFEKLISSLALPADVRVEIVNNWPTINSDPLLLRQIFQNLIENAVSYNTADQKHIELGWSQATNGAIEFSVRDNGIGIAPQYHEQIFRIFERLHPSSTYKGTGIGLSIVQRAVEKLGGTVRIESEEGKGTTFYVSLPQ